MCSLAPERNLKPDRQVVGGYAGLRVPCLCSASVDLTGLVREPDGIFALITRQAWAKLVCTRLLYGPLSVVTGFLHFHHWVIVLGLFAVSGTSWAQSERHRGFTTDRASPRPRVTSACLCLLPCFAAKESGWLAEAARNKCKRISLATLPVGPCPVYTERLSLSCVLLCKKKDWLMID